MKSIYLLFTIGIITILTYSLTSAAAESYKVETVAENLEIPWGIAFDDQAVGGISIPIDNSALLLAGVQSVSMWMIPVVLAGAGIGIFVIKRRS